MSCDNNAGSVPRYAILRSFPTHHSTHQQRLSVHYHTYDYTTHHVNPFGAGNNSGRHSTIDAFCDEPSSDKESLLGYGTTRISESEKKHKAAIEAQLESICVEQKFVEEPTQGGADKAKAGGGEVKEDDRLVLHAFATQL